MQTLAVQDYLRKFSSPQEALAAIREEFGIHSTGHKKYTNLYSLKYDMVESDKFKTHPVVRDCRGIILDSTLNTWKVVAYPFSRFFNFGDPKADDIDWDSAFVTEKVDGSLMILYYYDNAWQIASSGVPDAAGTTPYGDGKTFADLFWQTLGENIGWKYLSTFLHRLPKHMTFMLELTTPENKVVVSYKESQVHLLGARNIQTFEEFFPGAYVQYFPGIKMPRVFPIGSAKEAILALSDMKGNEQEGFVVVDSSFKRVKLKCPDYLALHHMAGHEVSVRMILNDVVLRGETAEYCAVFPEHAKLISEVQNRLISLENDLVVAYEKHKDIEVQKDFALAIREIKCSGALFSLRAGKTTSIHDFLFNLPSDTLLKILGYKNEK